MKLNNWSVVRSPNGISAKHLSLHRDIEVCVSMSDGKLNINVYRDGYDNAMKRVKMALKPRVKRTKPSKYVYQPSPETVEQINMWAAERAFNAGNEHMCWFYLFGIEFYKGESK